MTKGAVDPIRIEGTAARRRYIDACRQQMILWVNGRSVHNAVNGECTPDFSCCHPDMMSSRDERIAEFRRFLEEHGNGS